jgi:hypothetical protein
VGELIGEIIAYLLIELLFPILGELLSRIFAMLSGGLRSVLTRDTGLLAATFGAGLGFLSTVFLAHAMLPNFWFRLANVLITPLLVGYFAMLFGSARELRGKAPLPTDTFLYGYIMTTSYLITRWIAAA